MKVRSLVASTLSAVVLSACGESTPPDVAPVNQAPYVDGNVLPQVRVPVSGLVFDPEALFYSFVMWPPDPEDPEGGGPPPALLYGPMVMRVGAWGARVDLVGPDGRVADSGFGLPPWGSFQTQGLVADGETVYAMRAEPTPDLSVGAEDDFPAEDGFLPIPDVPYHATTTLRPVMPSGSQCMLQNPVIVGEAGALSALAATISDETGTPTTVSSLVDPASGRSVVLFWVYAPSPVLDSFMFPSGDIVAETTVGTLYSITWAPPMGIPGQSEMGYMVERGGVSDLGYYALVIPPGTEAPVAVSFVDTLTDAGQGRPWDAPSFQAPGVPPGLSFVRLFASEREEAPPPNPYEEEYPPPDFSFLCFPGP